MTHSPVVTVHYASAGWEAKLNSAIVSRNFVRIIIKGLKALQVKSILAGFPDVCFTPGPGGFVPIPYPNLKMPACLVSMPTLLNLILMALTSFGYDSMKAKFNAHGAGTGDDELIFDLR